MKVRPRLAAASAIAAALMMLVTPGYSTVLVSSGGSILQFSDAGVQLAPFATGTGGYLAVDSVGNVYVSSSTISSSSIHKFNSSGQNLGVFAPGFGGPIAVDTSNNVYAFSTSNTIHKFSPAGSDLGVIGTLGDTMRPMSIALDSSDTLYMAYDTGHPIGVWALRRYDSEGIDLGDVPPPPFQYIDPGAVTRDRWTGWVLCADWSWGVWRVGPWLIPFWSSSFPHLDSIAVGPDAVYAGSEYDGTIISLDPTGGYTGVYANVASPQSIAWTPFTVAPAPVTPNLTGLSPSAVAAGGSAFTLTVNGSNFTTNSTVRWNGSNRPTSFVSSTRLTAQIAAGDIASPGSVQVSVNAPGAGTSNTVIFTIGQPHLVTRTALARNGAVITATVTVTNEGTADAANVALKSATLGATAATPPVPAFGTVATGGSATQTVSFPAGGLTAGTASVLRVQGTYSGGTFGASQRVTIP